MLITVYQNKQIRHLKNISLPVAQSVLSLTSTYLQLRVKPPFDTVKPAYSLPVKTGGIEVMYVRAVHGQEQPKLSLSPSLYSKLFPYQHP
jgi:Sec7-like guanine-nucleotide exchange factor